MPYFVITPGEDGTRVQEFTKKELLERLDEGGWSDFKCSSGIPEGDADPNYWGRNMIIIEGKIIVPTAKQVTLKHTI